MSDEKVPDGEQDTAQLLDDVKDKLSLHEAALDEAPKDVDDVQPEQPKAVWKPRWRTDPSIRPTAYRAPSRKMGPLPTGVYQSKTIAERLGCRDHHSFLVAERKLQQCCIGAGSGEEGTVKHEHSVIPPENVAAIMYHAGANPDPKSPDSYEIWTRNCFEAIEASKGDPLPFYKHTTSNSALYEYEGTFQITAAELKKGKSAEVVEFVRQRGLSNKTAAPEVWRSRLVSDWLKVTITRVAAEEQQKDPLLAVERKEA